MKRKKMANCKNKRLIAPYLDGQLGECSWLSEHISGCSECMAEYEAIQRMKHLAKQLDFSPPESFYWKSFPSRVLARIATRQSQGFLARSRVWMSKKKFVIRILTPLMVAVVAVFIFRMVYHGGWHTEESLSIHVGGRVVAPSDYLGFSVSPADTPVSVGGVTGEILQQSETSPVVDILHIEPTYESSRAVVIADEVSIIDVEHDLDSDVLKILGDDYRQIDFERDGLVGVDLNVVGGYGLSRLTNFSSERMIRYQILAGFNSNMVPISSYREAAGKFFAPKTSVYSNIYSHKVSSFWGFASGDDKYDSEKLHRLMLELALSREK
jgi:hypothetical protein